MINHNQDGAVSGLGVSLVLTVLLLLGALGFGGWAFSQRQDYKNNVDAKIAEATDKKADEVGAQKEKEFAEREKQPLKAYNGPEAFGSLHIEFPKTWSGYVDDTGNGGASVDGYFAPGMVPSVNNQNSAFALRVQVINQPYAQILKTFESQQKAGKLRASAYALPKLPKVVGVQLNGQLSNQKTVTMVVLPLRAQTLQIWTEGTQYVGDFNASILSNFSFSP